MENKLRAVASLDQREMMELEAIILDKDYEEAYRFLKDVIFPRAKGVLDGHAEHERSMAQIKSKKE